MMKKIQRLVIADDLTGSSDTGVHFLSKDRDVQVVVDPLGDSPICTADTVVLNTNTRLCSPDTAYDKVKEGLDRYLSCEPMEIYKKVDSTLRGNVGREIDAVMDAVGFKLACVAPATPRNGRTVVDALCYVHGVKLGDTEIARDPFSPVHSSDIRDILAGQSRRKIGLLPLRILRAPRAEALNYLKAIVDSGSEIVVTDAETVEDLRIVREIFYVYSDQVLYVGSAGLFHAMGEGKRTVPKSISDGFRHSQHILFVVGSLMDISLAQVEHLETKYGLRSCMVNAERIENGYVAEIDSIVSEIRDAFLHSSAVILRTDRNHTGEPSLAVKVGSVLGEIVSKLLEVENLKIGTLVVTGGDTALNVLNRLHIPSIRLIDEALAGIPVSEIRIRSREEEILFVTKAGSYGEKDALEGVIEYLENLPTAEADLEGS